MRALLALLLVLLTISPARSQQVAVDVALVLALDVSGSMSETSWRAQREGIASAIDSEQFAQAIRRGQIGRIAITVVQWGTTPRISIEWRVIETNAQFHALAADIRAVRRAEAGGTCMGTMLMGVLPMLVQWAENATQRVIDISGDGSSNCGQDLAKARLDVIDSGVTINGLPILTPVEPKLVEWYETNVIGGPNSFLIVADGYDDFRNAFLKKLTTEIAQVIP